MTTKHGITIEFEDHLLSRYEDSYVAMLWHVAQANPADGFEDNEPNAIAERIGREIIRRWLTAAPIELHKHQGHHYYWHQLTKLGKWIDGVFVPADAATTTQGGDGGNG